MLNPVVIPVPLAIAVVAALAVFLGIAYRLLDEPLNAADKPTTRNAQGRHRVTAVREPYRPRPLPTGPTFPVIPGVADWTQPLTADEAAIDAWWIAYDTRELVAL